MAPRLDEARVNAVNEDLVGRGLHCWLLAPMGVWKLLGLTGRAGVTKYASFSPAGLLGEVIAKKRI